MITLALCRPNRLRSDRYTSQQSPSMRSMYSDSHIDKLISVYAYNIKEERCQLVPTFPVDRSHSKDTNRQNGASKEIYLRKTFRWNAEIG